jgi:hypothetical protein
MASERPEKNGFLIYKTQWEPISDLDNEELGLLMRAIFDYQINSAEPIKSSPIAVYFKFFKSQFTIDEIGYGGIVEQRRLAGIASAEKRKLEKEQKQQPSTNPTTVESVESVEQNQQPLDLSTKPTDKDNVNVNEKDNVNGNENLESKIGPISKSLIDANDSPWKWIKARKIIQANELILKYTYIDTEAKCLEWEKYLMANKPEIWERKDIKAVWNSCDWYLDTANNTAKRIAAERKANPPKFQQTVEIPKMPPLHSPFD